MNVSSPKISFVIPAHNRAGLIGDTIDSLIAQTQPAWEAVIVDDRSTDDLKGAVEKFNDPRLRHLRLPEGRGGAATARNYGNLHAVAPLIAVLDSDDLAKPNRAELALASYAEHQWDFYCTRRETEGTVTGALTKQTETPNEWDSELFKRQSYVTHSTVVYTKAAALEIPYNSALPCLIDYDLISRFIVADKKMFFSPEITAVWRRHDQGTITGSIPQETRYAYLQAIRSWRGWIDEPVNLKELEQ